MRQWREWKWEKMTDPLLGEGERNQSKKSHSNLWEVSYEYIEIVFFNHWSLACLLYLNIIGNKRKITFKEKVKVTSDLLSKIHVESGAQRLLEQMSKSLFVLHGLGEAVLDSGQYIWLHSFFSLIHATNIYWALSMCRDCARHLG